MISALASSSAAGTRSGEHRELTVALRTSFEHVRARSVALIRAGADPSTVAKAAGISRHALRSWTDGMSDAGATSLAAVA